MESLVCLGDRSHQGKKRLMDIFSEYKKMKLVWIVYGPGYRGSQGGSIIFCFSQLYLREAKIH
jgi:hypothetical protein